jgi:hypothetical protein
VPTTLTRSFLSLLLLLSFTDALPAQDRKVEDLLKLASDYYATYMSKISGVSLQEQYQLINVTGDKMQPAIRISSDVVLLTVNTGLVSVRDVFAVDTRRTRETGPRIMTLLAPPAAPTLKDWNTVQQYAADGAVHFQIDLILKLNEPTMAFRFLLPEMQGKVKYEVNGQKKINGVATVGLRFEEPRGQDTKYVLGTRGNGRASGRLWIDPATGAVHETELFVESAADSATIKIKFAPHATLGFLLPTETTETYAEKQGGNGIRGDKGSVDSGTSASRVSFQATAKYSNATYSPIDLRQLKK